MSISPNAPSAADQSGTPLETLAQFGAYTAAMEGDQGALLGHLVLYSIYDGRVTRDDLERWFIELELDQSFVPPPLRPMDAFEKVTGPAGVRLTYPLDGTKTTGRRRKRPVEGTVREATLMVRNVRRDRKQIVRHLIREVRDEQQTKLTYDTHLGEVIFHRDDAPGAASGAGQLQVKPDHVAIGRLPEDEQRNVHAILQEIGERFQLQRTFLSGDRLRAVVRDYIEGLNAIRVRPTGGVYFVHRAHAASLARLRELVSRMGDGSLLVRVPIPDQDEMREMVVSAFTTRAKDELDKLARDIALVQSSGTAADTDIQTLYARFRDLQAGTAEHAELLSTSLDDTEASLKLVNLQLAGLLAQAD
ncbi:HAMP domain-containing protein [Nonomuraea typhae]|uniref:HAMP domain-containing protein n=1 Tax=Nonomuraea typhae TaxID=2603600 RepID=UPI001CA52876|nr:DUF6744 family protein [Nonomuraea typhae]